MALFHAEPIMRQIAALTVAFMATTHPTVALMTSRTTAITSTVEVANQVVEAAMMVQMLE